MGRRPSILHSIALCYYKEKQPGEALKYLAQIIEAGVRGHPELGVGSGSAIEDARPAGNSQATQVTQSDLLFADVLVGHCESVHL